MTRLSTRLSAWYVATFILLLGAAFGISWIVIASLLQQQIDNDLVEDVDFFRQTFLDGGLEALSRAIEEEVDQITDQDEFIRLIDPDATSIDRALDNRPFSRLVASLRPPEIPANSNHVLRDLYLTNGDESGESGDPAPRFREISARVGPRLLLHAGESVTEQQKILTLVATCFIGVLLLGLPIAGIAGWLMARRASRDIEQIGAIASRIGSDNFDERISFQPADLETANLAFAFNHMLDRIRGLVHEIQDLTDNIAHDLKGPLARIRFMSEVILSRNFSFAERERYAEQTIEECDRLIHMIDTSLDVAEVEAGIHRNDRHPLNLSNLLLDAIDLFEPLAEEHHLKLIASIESDMLVLGNEQDLQRMVANLLDNGIKYTDESGTITIDLSREGNTVILTIADNGIGIDAKDQASVFRRFYRCDRSRSKEGCGLGLAFARAVARQMKGEITLQSAINEGSRFTTTLPLWAADRSNATPSSGWEATGRTDPAAQAQASMDSR